MSASDSWRIRLSSYISSILAHCCPAVILTITLPACLKVRVVNHASRQHRNTHP